MDAGSLGLGEFRSFLLGDLEMDMHAVSFGGSLTLRCGLTIGVDLVNGPGGVVAGRPYFLNGEEKDIAERGTWMCFGQTFVQLRKSSRAEQKAYFATRTVEKVALKQKRRRNAAQEAKRQREVYYKPHQGE
jgi:hypothetical protein